MDLMIGVDGGQSSTRTLLATTRGEVLGAHRTGPADHIHEPGGLERQYEALHEGYLGAFAAAGLSPRKVTCAYLGLTGSGHLETARRAIPAHRLLLKGDIHTAFAGALPDLVGVVVIAGTGSIAYGRDPGGREHRSGGWGYFAGDEGSGYHIARHAFRAVFQAEDGRGEPTCLSDLILQHYGCQGLKALHRKLYAGDISRDGLASAATCVASAASSGDPVAVGILERAAAELATLVTNTLDHLDLREARKPVAPIGGVFGSGELIQAPLLRRIHETHPDAHLQAPRLTPAQGAVVLALRELGIPTNDAILDNLSRAAPPASTAVSHATEGNRV